MVKATIVAQEITPRVASDVEAAFGVALLGVSLFEEGEFCDTGAELRGFRAHWWQIVSDNHENN
jgi:hypothetical protein